MAHPTLKETKARTKAVNLVLLEMEFSNTEILQFWQACLDEVQKEQEDPVNNIYHLIPKTQFYEN